MHLFHCHVQYFLIKTKKVVLGNKIIIESFLIRLLETYVDMTLGIMKIFWKMCFECMIYRNRKKMLEYEVYLNVSPSGEHYVILFFSSRGHFMKRENETNVLALFCQLLIIFHAFFWTSKELFVFRSNISIPIIRSISRWENISASVLMLLKYILFSEILFQVRIICTV